MSPELCNASLRVAGSLCSTCSEKYQGLKSKALPSSSLSTQFTAPMQSLSQAYNGLVDKCKFVVTEARAAVVRDPIVKKVKQLRRGQSQLEEMMERICSEEVSLFFNRRMPSGDTVSPISWMSPSHFLCE